MAHTAAHEHLWLLSTYVVRHTVRGMGAPAPPDVWASAFPMALPDALPRGTSMSPLRGGMRLREVLASRASPQKKAPVDRPLDTSQSTGAFAQPHPVFSAVKTDYNSPCHAPTPRGGGLTRVAGHSCLASPSVCSTSFQVRCLDGPYLPFFRMGNKKGVARRLLQEERCGRAPVKVLAWVWYTNCTRRAKFFVSLRVICVAVSGRRRLRCLQGLANKGTR